MAGIHFREIQELYDEACDKNQELYIEEKISEILSVPECLRLDASEIILGLSECSSDEVRVAFAYCDEILYARIFDGEKYLFPLPFMLTEDADAEEACVNLASYATREMIPLIITDVPRSELEFLCSIFPHVDACAYEEDDDCFFVKVNNECDLLSSLPTIELDGITLGEFRDEDREKYAQLCRDRDLNKYWGYDVDEDNPDLDEDFYLNVARREFNDGIAITLAIRESDEFVGEATIYGFDYRGSASIAVRVLKDCHSRGIGSRATKALVSLGKEIGLAVLKAEILNENESSIKMTAKYLRVEKRTESKTYFALSL